MLNIIELKLSLNSKLENQKTEIIFNAPCYQHVKIDILD